MYIKSLVVDGFKSYAQRTEITGFDQQFNAITGLNGSGKSNILDAICFLLGISNLSQVRATNLQDLVYKSGQAGITKATVSITFDNRSKDDSPYGYEQYDELTITRQVVLGGKNRYLINGNNATNTRVQDLFRSVQLNVNNPHFLIMQGRITKVLNMKPPEILSLLEEAASTKLYEHKKETALKTIEKKDNKLREIEALLREEITPTLSKLRQERSSYLEYQKVTRELEHLTKFWLAYQFTLCQETCAKSGQSLADMQAEREQLQAQVKDMEAERERKEAEVSELYRERDKLQGEDLERLEAEFHDAQKADVLVHSGLAHANEKLKQEQKNLRQIEKSNNEAAKNLSSKRNEMEKLRSGFESLRKRFEEDEAAVVSAQKHLQAVNSGLVSNEDGEAATLEEQLRAAKEESANAEIETKQTMMRRQQLQGELRAKEKELSHTNQDFAREEQSRRELGKQIAVLESNLADTAYSEEEEEQLRGEERKLRIDVSNLREKVDTIQTRFPSLNFDFTNPEHNFDRARVKGLVAKLLRIKDPKFATALEVTAGGKLYNVVVDTEQTSKALIQRGQLRRRVTFLPLNKIEGHRIPPHLVQKAKSVVGDGNAHTALSLVGYEPEIRAAMEYVFGQTFVCPDLDSAKSVTFHPQVQRRSVTLDGDQFDPQGTLSGGSRPQSSSLLVLLEELRSAESTLHSRSQRLAEVQKLLAQCQHRAEQFRKVNTQLQRARHELGMVEAQLYRTDYHQLKSEIEERKKEMAELEVRGKQAVERRERAAKKATSVQSKLMNKAAVRERELREAQAAVEAAKKRAAASSQQYNDQEGTVDALRLEIGEFEREIAGYADQVTSARQKIAAAEEELREKTEETNASAEAMDEVKRRLEEHRDLIKEKMELVRKRDYELKKHQKEMTASELKVEDLAHKIQTQTKESKDAARQVEAMLEQHPWIAEERRHFGKENSAYDFSTKDPRDAQKRIGKLQETKEKLSKTVNMRAMNMLGKAEEQYQELCKRREIVLNDKQKIQAIIDELDKKKNDALMQVYQQVNKSFGLIFGTLLPHSNAKLVPPEGKTVLDGLEFRVAFGDTWKETLSELSGGQRSLVALSLILALLRFKPAPLYILDEVDAALDLSHTQNIGQLIKQQFPQSQFIVVSLKDGMFNNANVLFKTKFVDGVSAVSRHVPSKPISARNCENEAPGRRKRP